MRFLAFAAATFLAGGPAWAQSQVPTVIGPPPAIVAAPEAPVAPQAPTAPQAPPPGLVETPAPQSDGTGAADVNSDTGNPASGLPPPTPGTNATATPPASPDVAPVPDNTWLPGNTATLGVLDKVDGSASEVSIAVGGQANIGDLQVSVQSCLKRPASDLPDAAIFLTLANPGGNSSAPWYRGWVIRSLPGANVAGDAGEIFRVIDCS